MRFLRGKTAFRKKCSTNTAFFRKKIGCFRENIIYAVFADALFVGRSAVALSMGRSLLVALRATLF